MSEHHPPTSVDVARRAGVSQTTVSYVLNGVPNGRISPQTRERVLAAARELNYQIQPSARALRKGHTDEIYFVVTSPLTLFLNAFIKTMQLRAQELGYTLAVYYFHEDLAGEAWRDFLLRLFSQRPVGIIGFPESITQEEIELAKSKGSGPCVFISDQPVNYAPTVQLQAYEAGSLVARHFLERGHRRISLIAPQNRYQSHMVEPRLAGLRSLMEKSGAYDVQLFPVEAATLEEARRIARQLVADPSRPTALYGFNDEYAVHLLRAFYEQSLRVPEDIALVGTDDTFICELTVPSLTSVRLSIVAIAQRIIDLIDRLAHPEIPALPLPPLPLPELVKRESS